MRGDPVGDHAKLCYTEVTKCTSHPMFIQFITFLEVEDLVQAEVLTTTGSDWAKLMSWALTFAATSCAKSVPESERAAKLTVYHVSGLQGPARLCQPA